MGGVVAPAELEALLLQHPDVADAAVIGIYSKEEATELPRYGDIVSPYLSKLALGRTSYPHTGSHRMRAPRSPFRCKCGSLVA